MEQDKKIVQEEELSVELNEAKLSLKFTVFTDYLKITLSEGNNNYEHAYNLEELINIHQIFKAMKSIEKVFEHFSHLIKEKKYALKKVNENEIDLIFKITFIIETRKIALKLIKVNKIKN